MAAVRVQTGVTSQLVIGKSHESKGVAGLILQEVFCWVWSIRKRVFRVPLEFSWRTGKQQPLLDSCYPIWELLPIKNTKEMPCIRVPPSLIPCQHVPQTPWVMDLSYSGSAIQHSTYHSNSSSCPSLYLWRCMGWCLACCYTLPLRSLIIFFITAALWHHTRSESLQRRSASCVTSW